MASSSSLASFTCLSSLKMTVMPMAALSSSHKTAIPYELKKGQNRLFYKLSSGLKMEVIEQRKCVAGSEIHRWCLYMEATTQLSVGLNIGYLSSGFDSYAISLLGQGKSQILKSLIQSGNSIGKI